MHSFLINSSFPYPSFSPPLILSLFIHALCILFLYKHSSFSFTLFFSYSFMLHPTFSYAFILSLLIHASSILFYTSILFLSIHSSSPPFLLHSSFPFSFMLYPSFSYTFILYFFIHPSFIFLFIHPFILSGFFHQ